MSDVFRHDSPASFLALGPTSFSVLPPLHRRFHRFFSYVGIRVISCIIFATFLALVLAPFFAFHRLCIGVCVVSCIGTFLALMFPWFLALACCIGVRVGVCVIVYCVVFYFSTCVVSRSNVCVVSGIMRCVPYWHLRRCLCIGMCVIFCSSICIVLSVACAPFFAFVVASISV